MLVERAIALRSSVAHFKLLLTNVEDKGSAPAPKQWKQFLDTLVEAEGWMLAMETHVLDPWVKAAEKAEHAVTLSFTEYGGDIVSLTDVMLADVLVCVERAVN